MKSPKLVAAMVLFAAAALVFGTRAFSVNISAQTKTEICDNKIDDDGDGLVDANDPDCQKQPPSGTPCSPGYWKNHQDQWVGIYCTTSSTPSCLSLLTALTCKGSDASCGRSAAAAFLNNLTGCTE